MLAASLPDMLVGAYRFLRAKTPPQEMSTDLFDGVHGFVTSTQVLWSECEELYRELNEAKLLDDSQVDLG